MIVHAKNRRIGWIALICFAIAGPLVLLSFSTERPVVMSKALAAKSARITEISFDSVNADRRDVFETRTSSKTVRITATFWPPQGASRPTPAAVLIHGSDGVTRLQHQYAEWLSRRGIAALVVDSFRPRHVSNTIGKQQLVSSYSMVADAFAALSALSRMPDIDVEKIFVIGWSKGGVVADWASRQRYRRAFASANLEFAGHVAFYPWCGEQETEISITGAPLLFLVGAKDDWVGSQACENYVERVRDSGHRANLLVFDDAHHGFDYPGTFNRYIKDALSWRNCSYFVRDDGFVEASTGRHRSWRDYSEYVASCTSKGVHVASNAKARIASKNALDKFIQSIISN